MEINLLNEITVKEIEKMVGHNKGTYSDELEKVGKKLFGKKFDGVYSADNYRLKKNKYFIVNLDKVRQPGSHWIAIATDNKNRAYLYDSFGRDTKEIIDVSGNGNNGTYDAEHDAEQDDKEENCGQRSLAWLFIYDKWGKETAMQI
jgi:hypothetical protein